MKKEVRKQLFLVLLTTYGMKQGPHSGMIVKELTMDDLFLEK